MRTRLIQPVMPSQIHSDKELCSVFHCAAALEHDPYWRPKVMLLRLGTGGGFRAGEMLRLRADDVNLEEGTISVWRSKTGRRRVVAASPELRPYLAQFVMERSGQRLFKCSRVKTLERWIDELFEEAGVPKIPGRCVHALRHDYASYELASRRLLPHEVQAQLGHSTIEMTLGEYSECIKPLLYAIDKTPAWWQYALPERKLRVVKEA